MLLGDAHTDKLDINKGNFYFLIIRSFKGGKKVISHFNIIILSEGLRKQYICVLHIFLKPNNNNGKKNQISCSF